MNPLDEDGSRYQYEDAESEFAVELSVNSEELVVTYPVLFNQVSFS